LNQQSLEIHHHIQNQVCLGVAWQVWQAWQAWQGGKSIFDQKKSQKEFLANHQN